MHFQGHQPGPFAELYLHDWGALASVLTSGDIAFAESCRDGKWTSPEPANLLTLALLNQNVLRAVINGRWWTRWIYRLMHASRRNSRAGSRRNIHAHYDIGNAFYRLWLDPAMNYSSALFSTDSTSLAEAQIAKHERILQQLGVGPDDHILEIGCGWGSFAAYAARTRGCRVTGITLSSEQFAWATERIQEQGLAAQVDFRLCDYRDINGRYDHIVSIEMFEAVGEAWWGTYFDMIHQRLRRGGRALIQTITIDDDHFDFYRRSSDFIQQHIFPGGMLPCMKRIRTIASERDLFIADCHAFGQDYATTLRHWRTRFDAAVDQVRALGYDDAFIRIWQFYLAYCEAGFRTRRTDVVQLEIWHD